MVRHKLADMATRIAAVRALTGDAVVRMVRGENAPALAAMTKNAGSDMLTAAPGPSKTSLPVTSQYATQPSEMSTR